MDDYTEDLAGAILLLTRIDERTKRLEELAKKTNGFVRQNTENVARLQQWQSSVAKDIDALKARDTANTLFTTAFAVIASTIAAILGIRQ